MSYAYFDDPETPTRRLARSLLLETLARLRGHAEAPPQAPVLPTGRYRHWTYESCFAALLAFRRREGRFPLAREWAQSHQHGLPARSILARYFGPLEVCKQLICERLAEEL